MFDFLNKKIAIGDIIINKYNGYNKPYRICRVIHLARKSLVAVKCIRESDIFQSNSDADIKPKDKLRFSYNNVIRMNHSDAHDYFREDNDVIN